VAFCRLRLLPFLAVRFLGVRATIHGTVFVQFAQCHIAICHDQCFIYGTQTVLMFMAQEMWTVDSIWRKYGIAWTFAGLASVACRARPALHARSARLAAVVSNPRTMAASNLSAGAFEVKSRKFL
jgi:hypothetical protein